MFRVAALYGLPRFFRLAKPSARGDTISSVLIVVLVEKTLPAG